jgi:hypothetical protein
MFNQSNNTIMKTLEQKVNELKANHLIEVIAQELKYEAIKKTGFENVISYTHRKGLSFFWSGREKAGVNEIAKIIKAYPINGKNHKLNFCSKDAINTDSPLFVRWNDNSLDAEIRYETKGGIEIQININLKNHFGSTVYNRPEKGRHLGFGRYETIMHWTLDPFGTTQRYSGGSMAFYFLEGAESKGEFERFVLSGEFSYDCDYQEEYTAAIKG